MNNMRHYINGILQSQSNELNNLISDAERKETIKELKPKKLYKTETCDTIAMVYYKHNPMN